MNLLYTCSLQTKLKVCNLDESPCNSINQVSYLIQMKWNLC